MDLNRRKTYPSSHMFKELQFKATSEISLIIENIKAFFKKNGCPHSVIIMKEGRKKMYVLAENWHGLWRRKLIDLYESWNCLNPCLYRYFCFQKYTLARRGGMCLLVSYSGDRRIVWAQGLGGQLWHLFLRETKACMQKPGLTAEGPQSPRSAGSASPYRRWTLQMHSEGGMRVWVSKGL